jgi:hypothetical protein
MNLEQLKERALELERALTQTTNQYQIITGHIAENKHCISELEKAELAKAEVEPVANPEVPPVV